MTHQIRVSDTDPQIGISHLTVEQAMALDVARGGTSIVHPTMHDFLLLSKRVSDLEQVVMALSEPWWKRLGNWVKDLFSPHG